MKFFAFLAVSMLTAFTVNLPAVAAGDIATSVTEWNIMEREQMVGSEPTLDGRKVSFDRSVTIVSKPAMLDLFHKKVLKISFPKIEGVVDLRVKVLAAYQGKERFIGKSATLLPGGKARTLRFDFSGEANWKGFGKGVAIKLEGVDAAFELPEVILEEATFFKRFLVFIETWLRPIKLVGVIVNLFEWPGFFGIPSLTALGIFWGIGSVAIAAFTRLRRNGFFRLLVAWSLIVWVSVDVTLKIAAMKSLPRYGAMEGRLSDSLGLLYTESAKMALVLKDNKITRLNLVAHEFEEPYLRFALRPAHASYEYKGENVVLLRKGNEYSLQNSVLEVKGEIILTHVEVLKDTGAMLLVKGEPA